MNVFQTFFPLALLLAVSLIGGWVLPNRRSVSRWMFPHHRQRKDPTYDIDATIAHHREALSKAMVAAREAMKAAREANREFEHLVEAHKKKAS